MSARLEGFQCHNGAQQLHAIVGSQPIPVANLFAMPFIQQHRTKSARSRIAQAAAIAIDFDRFQIAHMLSNPNAPERLQNIRIPQDEQT